MDINNVMSALAAGSTKADNILGEAGMVVLIGLVVVFLTLIMLTAIFWLFGKIMHRNTKHENVKKQSVSGNSVKKFSKVHSIAQTHYNPVIQSGVSDEVVAVIAAAVAAMSQDGEIYSLRSVRRVRGDRPVWAAAGIMEGTRPF